MDYFTSRNLCVLALVQVGVVIVNVLSAGAAQRWYTELIAIGVPDITMPLPCRLLTQYGWLMILLPVGWLSGALKVLHGQDASRHATVGVVSAGLLLLAGLVMLWWFGVASPWLYRVNTLH